MIRTDRKKQVVPLTQKVQRLIEEAGFEQGFCHLFVTHTTCALTTADLDPGTDRDMLDAFSEMVPKLNYRHPHDPSHVGDHIMASLIGPDVSVPVEHGKLVLGTWQEVVLVEFNGPKEREMVVNFRKSE
jgi:secondary thiamine-phosphate synthase enzyme